MHEIIIQLEALKQEFESQLNEATNEPALEAIRNIYLSRKGKIAALFKLMGSLAPEERGAVGKALNDLKQSAADRWEQARQQLQQKKTVVGIDVTLPARPQRLGSLHILTLVERRVREIFTKMGFTVERGPEVEDVWHNFDALNTPEWHPSRDPTDTFYLKDGRLLRTETSPIQIRVMQSRRPPLRIIAPGRVFRNDKPDATHSPMFTQVEGLYVDQGVTFADLKGTVLQFYRQVFGREVQTRFRPHFFPFTEPSAEVDISCIFCRGKECHICKGSGWIEMGGSGMVDPNVFKAVDIDPEIYTGWAFGLGIERMAMLMYGIEDIRLFYENDFRFLRQFGGRR